MSFFPSGNAYELGVSAMDDCVYLHWAGDGPQALSQRIDLRSHLGAVLESHFTTRYWKRYHSKRLRYLSVFSNVNYYVNDVINLFYFQHLTICFISYLTWSSIRRTRRKSWAIFWRAPSPMTASRQNSFTGELFELFFEWRIDQILTHVKNNFHLATHVWLELF